MKHYLTHCVNGIAKRQDRFSHRWSQLKQPENLGHVRSGDPEMTGKDNSGFHLVALILRTERKL